jgi:serine/threonine protein kinase
MATQQIGRFQVGRLLGSGNQGKVYLCHDSELERRVAIKLLNNALPQTSFRDEARTMSRLQHPNIVTIYEAGEHQGAYYLVFEYVEGELLSEAIAGKPIELRESLNIFQGLLEGVAEAHKAGIVHRDLKPSNVILTQERQAKIGFRYRPHDVRGQGAGSSADRNPPLSGAGVYPQWRGGSPGRRLRPGSDSG